MKKTFLLVLFSFFFAAEVVSANSCRKILVMADGNFLSHTSRPLEVAKVLRRRGYDVEFAVSGKYEQIVRDENFRVLSIRPSPVEQITRVSRRGFCNWLSTRQLRECVKEDQEIYRASHPDLVLSDFRYSVLTSAEAWGVPHAMIINASWSNNFTGKLTAPDSFFLTKWIGEKKTTAVMPFLKDMILRHGVWAHNRVRRLYDLEPARDLFDLFERANLGLIADIPSYGPTQGLPSSQRYVGPLTWEPQAPLDPRVETWSPHVSRAYVTMGSTGDAGNLREAVAALEEMGIQCLVSTGKLGEVVPKLETTFVNETVPGLAAAEAVDVVVCQGGNGTLYQSLLAGKPIVGIARIHDQHFNLNQVEAMGMGTNLRERGLTRAKIKEAVIGVLSNSEIRGRAQALKTEFEQYRGAETAADQIERFLDREKP